MKLTALFVGAGVFIQSASAAYSGNIVQYWNTALTNALTSSSPRFSSVHEGWAAAFAHTSILSAAAAAKSHPQVVQQIAVSHAAHDVLSHIFNNQQPTFIASLKKVLEEIGGSGSERERGKKLGQEAAMRVVKTRAGDGADQYVEYNFKPAAPGVYQPTPPGNGPPSAPNGRYIRPFGGVGKTEVWKVPPPDPTKPGYEAEVLRIYEKGAKTGSTRTAEETEIGYYWLESSATWWNRFASALISRRNPSIYETARFFALLNYAIANAGFVGWESKYVYNAWRPITAIRYPTPYLAEPSLLALSQPSWEPLVNTPVHPDYLSGHAVYGGGGGGILKRYFGGDKIEPPLTLSSNASTAGYIERTFSSVAEAERENGDSRVFVGVHFQFASDEGTKAGDAAAKKVWDLFDRGWDKF